MKSLLPFAIILAFSFCYMEWGGGKSSFIFQLEKAVFNNGNDLLAKLTHPLILFVLPGQMALFVAIFTPDWLSKSLTRAGIALLGTIVLFVLLSGALSGNWKIIGSTLPFFGVGRGVYLEGKAVKF